MITKLATYLLQKHQQRITDKLNDPNTSGIVAWHSLGSGKTLTALHAVQDQLAQHPGSRALSVVPAPLVGNMQKEIDKHKMNIPASSMDIMSYDKAVNRMPELMKNHYSMAVLDEGHKLRNTNTKRYTNLKKLLGQADKRLILTGTMAYNNIGDIAPLVDLATNDFKTLPVERKEFNAKYTKERTIRPGIWDRLKGKPSYKVTELNNTKDLHNRLHNVVDYQNSLETNPEDFPTLSEKVVPIRMDHEQDKMYKFLEGKVPYLIRKKIEWGLPLDKQESKDLNALATGIRQVSDSITPYKDDGKPYNSPKINNAVDNLIGRIKGAKNHKAIVYSNFIKAGLDPYSSELTKRGIAHTVYTGKLNDKERKKLVTDFNADSPSGDPKVLLLSSSGGEGLDLKGVRQVQVLEPHFNKSKIDQVVGRARRFRSHAHLPEDQRHVDVEYYHSLPKKQNILSKVFFGNHMNKKTIDPYLYDSSNQKDSMNQQLINLVKNKDDN